MSHFYEKTEAGVIPRHFVPMSSRPGETRPTRITDAKKAGWYPSVTTIQGLLDKPALTDWKIQEHLKQAYQYPAEGDLESWIESIKFKTRAELDKAPQAGTDFHDVLEQWFSGNMVEDPYRDRCKDVEDCIKVNAAMQIWKSEVSFVHESGFAGKVDLHSKAPNGYTSGWVIDFKTKNTADKWKPGKMAYPEMAMQLAAYRYGLGIPSARCANVFVCLETGEVEFHEWPQEALEMEWANFADLLRIWLRKAAYIPGVKV